MIEPLKPSPKDISEIIEKFENLKIQNNNLEKTPLDFPKGEETELTTVKRLVNSDFQQSKILTASQLFAPDEIKQKLTNLSVEALETLTTLLNQNIPKLKSEGKIRELQNVQYFVKLELEKKVKEAKVKRWAHHISPLIAEIDLDLTPWRSYLSSICAALGQFDANLLYVGPFIEHAEFSKCIEPIIHDLKRIKRVREKELEADPARTKQNAFYEKVIRVWNYFLDLYERTLKALFDSILGKYGPK
jgi:hypothetical protein